MNAQKPDRVREVVVKLLDAMQAGGEHPAAVIASVFKLNPQLGTRARDNAVDVFHGILHHWRRIDELLAAATKRRAQPESSSLALFVAYKLAVGQFGIDQANALLPDVNWSAALRADERIEREKDPALRLAMKHSLPDFLAARLLEEYGDDAEPLAASFAARAPLTLRVNTLKAARDEVLEKLNAGSFESRATTLSPSGIELLTRTNVFEHKLYRDGLIEVQDEASQLATLLVAPPMHGLVIDACAGAGGKTLALGALMNNKGRLVALDVHDKRLDELRRRARRAGLANTRAVLLQADGDKEKLAEFTGRADRVLADVPCSGTGAIRRKPDIRWRLTEDDLRRLPLVQEQIARRAMALCKPGGRMIYSTCTVLKEENESVVARLLDGGDFKLVPIKEILGRALADKIVDPTGCFMKLLPHRHNTDGFFAAVLRRSNPAG